MKFKPDYFEAATHMTEAAQSYLAGRMEVEGKAAYVKAAELRLKDNDHSSAARCYELSGNFDKAADCYMICGSLDQAVRSVMKKATNSTDTAVQFECFEKAIDIYSKDDGKEVLASDIFKQYIPKLLIAGEIDRYYKISNRYIQILTVLEQWPFVHKELLSQVIVNIAKGEIVGAERVLSGPNLNATGFVHSQEFAAADDLITAMRENDAEALKKVVTKPCVTYLNTEVVKMARAIKTIAVATVSEGGASKPDAVKPHDVDSLLL